MGSSSVFVAWLEVLLRRSVPNYYNYSKRRPVRRSDCLQSIHSRASDSGSYGNCKAFKSEIEVRQGAVNFDSGADAMVEGDRKQSWN